MDENDAYEDQLCFLRTIRAFQNYRQESRTNLTLRQSNFEKLSVEHKRLLPPEVLPSGPVFQQYQNCIEANAIFFDDMCRASWTLSGSYWPDGFSNRIDMKTPPMPSALDSDKVYSTMRQFVRDWSSLGEPERETVYGPIRTTLCALFPDASARGDIRVLVPGSGLSRLMLEIALLGFWSQGNEFSYHMLIGGHFVLNHLEAAGQYNLYPFVDSTVNVLNRSDQFRCVPIPDKATFEAIEELEASGGTFGSLSMVAGDFTEVFQKPKEVGTWNSVVTCFFIDTAHNIVEYLEIIYKLLVPGGVWINCGPLLYHFADSTTETSIELAYNEVMAVVRKIGFIVDQETMINTTYTNNPLSMKQMLYRCAFSVARKPSS